MIHPKKGSPSGRNAYPVTEKMEELKEEEKNVMAKKKTFEEYTQEALYEIEKTEAALKQAKLDAYCGIQRPILRSKTAAMRS